MVKPKQIKTTTVPETETENNAVNPTPENEIMGKLGTILATHTTQFEKILTAIQDTKNALEAKIDTVTLDVGLLRSDHKKLAERVTSVELINTTTQPEIKTMQQEINRLTTGMEALHKRAEEAEGHSRRNNIRFIGFRERVETPAADLFLEKWLTTNVFANKLPKFFSVERAHRTPGRPPAPGAPARPIIARFLNYRDLLLHIFRTKGPFAHENNKISAYPDFTAEVQRRRASFLKVKSQLRSLNMQYALIYPAKLRVVDGENTHFFTTPEDTWTWLHAKGLVNESEATRSRDGWTAPK